MKWAFLSLAVAGAVSAQSNATSALIPSGISTQCSTFLAKLDSDSTLTTCVTPLINATASFSPTSGTNLTESDINYTLATLCKQTQGCEDTTIRSWLSQFYTACSAELTGNSGEYNAKVRDLYDILYVFQPMKGAVCAIDSANQDYCVNEIINATKALSSVSAPAAGNASSFISLATIADPVQFASDNLYIVLNTAATAAKRALRYLAARAPVTNQFGTVIAPNTTTYRSTNLPFMFLQPSLPQSTLCTPCTREIMVSYMKFETAMPYALGLSQSTILGGQSTLWAAINSTCGAAYVSSITAEVGTLAASTNGSISAASPRWTVATGPAGATAAVGVALVAGAMVFLA